MDGKNFKHVMVRTATHRKLMIEAAVRGRKVYELADELLAKGLGELPPAPQPTTTSVAQPG